MTRLVLVDFENIQQVKFGDIGENTRVFIFTGKTQKKIPFELVKEAQRHGPKIEWIPVNGQGKNTLDFFIAYYLGVFSLSKEYSMYYILSKDKGYDPLVEHLKAAGKNVRRIGRMDDIEEERAEAENARAPFAARENAIELNVNARVIGNLKKIAPPRRPKKEAGLLAHIRSMFPGRSDDEIREMIRALYDSGALRSEKGRIAYNL